eukprot:CAMPEP_0203667816 /NCGR_PEP_ID=MMETSP0090-20130426/4568_1 /ASSEMBLY_ACC=CAM_ASM_001088 /TAXON_ID=426623 /ORGANISM="Chaetoceros affinis, Strain CCMP159" /LENGTH=580 /DNA_ID=CAMNT_0050532085 /DNA_START=332 /DNA_END=2074 /DNA_ORIENTATION=+
MTPPNASVSMSSPSADQMTSSTSSPSIPSSPAPSKSASTTNNKMTSTTPSSSSSSSSSNYAAPHTPIASAKRPRSQHNSAVKSNGKTLTNGRRSRSSIGTSNHTYGREIVNNANSNIATATSSTSAKKEEELNLTPVRKMKLSDAGPDAAAIRDRVQMSPMHKPRPAVERVNAVSDNEANEEYDQEVQGQGLNGKANNQNATANTTTNNKWVGIFSPVLNFLSHTTEGQGESEGDNQDEDEHAQNLHHQEELEEVEEEEVDVVRDSDGDVTMKTIPTSATTTNLKIQNDVDQTGKEENVGVHTPTSASSFSINSSHSQASMEATEEYANLEEQRMIEEQQQQQDESYDQYYHHEEDVHEEEEDEDEFNPYLFIKFLPPYSSVVHDPEQKICLPPKDKSDPPITLVLDLDETLVHCTVEPIPDATMVFPVYFNGVQYSVHVRTRPYLEQFLESVAKKFEVVVFTASQKVYADELLNRIDPEGKYIKHRMFRESCLLVEGNYLKDLNVLGRDLSTAVLVDNSPHAFGYQVDNGIPIESWFEDPNDVELLKLDHFLNTLHGVKDVRTMVRSKFQTYKLIRDAK